MSARKLRKREASNKASESRGDVGSGNGGGDSVGSAASNGDDGDGSRSNSVVRVPLDRLDVAAIEFQQQQQRLGIPQKGRQRSAAHARDPEAIYNDYALVR